MDMAECFECNTLLVPADYTISFPEETNYHNRDGEQLCNSCGVAQSEQLFMDMWGIQRPEHWDKWSATDKALWETQRELDMARERVGEMEEVLRGRVQDNVTREPKCFVLLYAPKEYFSPTATPAEKETLEMVRGVAREVSEGTRNYAVLPAMFDERGNRTMEMIVTPLCEEETLTYMEESY